MGETEARLTALERLQAQQEQLNGLLIDMTGRLSHMQALQEERLARVDLLMERVLDALRRLNGPIP